LYLDNVDLLAPSYQFPTGITMSLPRRLELLAWARRAGALIFEDDYDSGYRYTGPSVEALHALDTAESVIYAGTFSKSLFPALRLGYLVLSAKTGFPTRPMLVRWSVGNPLYWLKLEGPNQ